jgi:hypothetical protein
LDSGIWQTLGAKSAIPVTRLDQNSAYAFGLDGVENRRGGNVANLRFAFFTLALASTLFSVQATAQELRDHQSDLASTFVGRPVTCSEPQKLVISHPFAERAKLKARLYNLLLESLYDDAKGIVNIAREKEIRELASKLKKER